MRRAAIAAVLAVLAMLSLAACGADRTAVSEVSFPRVASPPGRASWPPYPDFPTSSCYARNRSGGMMRFAPSVLPPPPAVKESPEAILERVLQGLPDRSLVRGGTFGTPPARVSRWWYWHKNYEPAPPPEETLWLYLDAPLAVEPDGSAGEPSPAEVVEWMRATWQATLVAGAVRDLLCAERLGPLVGWQPTRYRRAHSDYEGNLAFNQQFPNLTPGELRRRAELAARRLGAKVVAVTLLEPLGYAPDVVFQTSDRDGFARAISALDAYLDPGTSFEGFFLEGVDESGKPFIAAARTARGLVYGSQMAREDTCLPYQTLGGSSRSCS